MDWSVVSQTIIEAIAPIMLSLLTYLGYVIKKKIDTFIDTKQKKDIVNNVVRYVDQAFKNYTNGEKKHEALEKTSEWLTEKGITFTKTELNILIESSVNALREGYLKAECEVKEQESVSQEEQTLLG